jgi:hypothetical protein
MSRTARVAIVGCWLVIAFTLLRMAWGGSVGGIIYVIGATHPVVLVAGLVTVVGAVLVSILFLAGDPLPALTASIALGVLAVPLGVVLIPDHGSAPLVIALGLVAVGLSARTRLRLVAGTIPGGQRG